MPKGLKPTSSQIVVSFSTQESSPNTYTAERIDLQLNALDNEVFVITGVKMDTTNPQFNLADPVANFGSSNRSVKAALSKQDVTNSFKEGLGNPSIFATTEKEILLQVTESLSTGQTLQFVTSFQEDSIDTPFNMEYIDIIATPDFYVNIEGEKNANRMEVRGKLYGYRAKADSSTYAALVQSELLSQ